MRRCTLFSFSVSRALLPCLALGAALLWPARAAAYDSLAAPCTANPLYCESGHITFQHTDSAPIQFHFDTGWVPQGSSLEVDISANVWATTHVSLAGSLATSWWPKALALATPGDKKGGDLGFHYGADFSAQGKIQVSVLGQKFSWQGDLPYTPQFDFQVEADQPFDAWGFAPGVTLSSETMPQQIATVDIASVVGSAIPGISGGFQLDVGVQITATYVTDQIVIDAVDGESAMNESPVAGGPITSEAGKTNATYVRAPSVEFDVHPEGTVTFSGTVHMIPTFYVKILGQGFSIPVADIPMPFPITSNKWVFDTQRVHVPLPELVVSTTKLDFGDLAVGETAMLPVALTNAGEAAAKVKMSSSDAKTYALSAAAAALAPMGSQSFTVSFAPAAAGPFAAKITVASNNPGEPVQLIEVTGQGIGASSTTGAAASSGSGAPTGSSGSGGAGAGGGGSGSAGAVASKGGCSCRTGDGGGDRSVGAWVSVAVAAWAAARRPSSRRSSARS